MKTGRFNLKQMAKLLDKIVVIDVEATCWEGAVPEGMMNEIIEIGVAVLDVASGAVVENESILVKPEKSTISSFCTSLTTLTADLIDKEGISFKAACSLLKKKYETGSRAWASFGAYDQKQFRRQCEATGVGYPFGPSYINVKTLFALKKKLAHEQGMAGALALLDIPLQGTHHRGVDDANNIAKILRWILT